jgi:hypothetical protein
MTKDKKPRVMHLVGMRGSPFYSVMTSKEASLECMDLVPRSNDPEYIHVIEYAAYAELSKENEFCIMNLKHNADKIIALEKENEELKLQLEFTKAYRNPEDTSFRDMMNTFHELSADQKDKLIDLSRSLARLAETK